MGGGIVEFWPRFAIAAVSDVWADWPRIGPDHVLSAKKETVMLS
jgi:hypothetical protein